MQSKSREWKLQALRGVLGKEALIKGDEAVFFCPKCRHHKPKLSINLSTDWVHCWICDEEMRGKTLVPVLRMGGNTPELQEYLESVRGRGFVEKRPEKEYEPVRLPLEFKSLTGRSTSPYHNRALAYLFEERGLSMDDVFLYRLGYCEDGFFKNRVIIPSFDQYGGLNFVTARAIYKNMGPNYRSGEYSKDIIWNDYLVDWTRPVTLTEGPFDAIKGGTNCIALQGSSLDESTKLFEKIVTTGVDVHFALDSDALKKQLRIIKKFLEYGVRSYYVRLGGHKDVGEMPRGKFQELLPGSLRVRDELDLAKIRIVR